MSPATGATLPPEILSYILDCLTPTDLRYDSRDKYRRAKHGLAAPSLVCKHWSEATRPFLFQFLILSGPDDVQFLKGVVYSPQFVVSSLYGAIEEIEIRQENSNAKPWLHHVHALSSQLRETTFKCTVANGADDPASTVCCRAPFYSLPRIPPPSNLRFFRLTLEGLVFTSKTELARLIDSFSTLAECYCDHLTFVDASPVVQSRRIRRRSSSSLRRCEISRCKETAISVQVTLASDILSAAARLRLDVRLWSAALEALLALAPSTFKRASVFLNCPYDNPSGTSLKF